MLSDSTVTEYYKMKSQLMKSNENVTFNNPVYPISVQSLIRTFIRKLCKKSSESRRSVVNFSYLNFNKKYCCVL